MRETTCGRCALAAVPLSTDGTHLLDGWRRCGVEQLDRAATPIRRRDAQCAHPSRFKPLGAPGKRPEAASGGDAL